MFDKFLSIEEEKRERVINAALEEFAQKGYQAASTNAIAKAAGISKGLLFHYFVSKKDLCLYLYDHAAKLLSQEIRAKVDPEERDLFVKLRQVSAVKLHVFKLHPDMLQFLKMAFFEEAADVKAELAERNKSTAANEYYSLFANIDRTRFKEGVDPERAMNVVLWSMEGLGEQERQRHKLMGAELDVDRLMEEFDRYMELFKRSFYKE
ncbi:TetR/AcrR family transcriptional regulator [Paenibacillus sp. PL2-23]|uniref:TetR/AcrR family transcriptional regulator n=1 Tax=Paenibacillus sp. PL2-23 TaxID=2100729 RepID=UPI0030F6FCB7